MQVFEPCLLQPRLTAFMLEGVRSTAAVCTGEKLMANTSNREIRSKLEGLRVEHRDLDTTISRLAGSPHINELQLKRLKKRKLRLKDYITRLESLLIPDLDA